MLCESEHQGWVCGIPLPSLPIAVTFTVMVQSVNAKIIDRNDVDVVVHFGPLAERAEAACAANAAVQGSLYLQAQISLSKATTSI